MSIIRDLVRPVLNQLRNINRLSLLENFLAGKTQGKSLSNFWVRCLPPLESYKKGSIRIVKRNGIKYQLDISDYVQYVIYFGLDVEPKKALYDSIHDGMHVFDIGTNIGETLLNFAKLNPSGINYGFEPVPFLYEKAKQNIELNQFENISLHNLALSDTPASLFFELPSNRNYGSINMSTRSTNQSKQVKAVTFDQFVTDNKIEKVDFLKIDVEGFEYKVIQGAVNTISNRKPVLFIELIDDYLKKNGNSAAQLVQNLSVLGYNVYDADSNAMLNSNSNFTKRHIDILCVPIN
jgi:FkbM family methyltransferase